MQYPAGACTAYTLAMPLKSESDAVHHRRLLRFPAKNHSCTLNAHACFVCFEGLKLFN